MKTKDMLIPWEVPGAKQVKPGSGRYEYIDLENAGGVTMELLWNHP